jgi:hypothetical protein
MEQVVARDASNPTGEFPADPHWWERLAVAETKIEQIQALTAQNAKTVEGLSHDVAGLVQVTKSYGHRLGAVEANDAAQVRTAGDRSFKVIMTLIGFGTMAMMGWVGWVVSNLHASGGAP